MLIASDIDGVLFWNLYDKKSCWPNLHKYYTKCIPTGIGFATDKVAYITGRKECYRNVTAVTLDKFFMPLHPTFHFPRGVKKTKRSFLEFKVDVINNLKPKYYIDDDLAFVTSAKPLVKRTKMLGLTITPHKDMAQISPESVRKLKVKTAHIIDGKYEYRIPKVFMGCLDELLDNLF